MKTKRNPGDLPEFVLDDTSQFILYMADHVVTGLRHYCNLFQDTEVGGVMYGRHFKRGSLIVVDIDWWLVAIFGALYDLFG
jgi:hypothetical protein